MTTFPRRRGYRACGLRRAPPALENWKHCVETVDMENASTPVAFDHAHAIEHRLQTVGITVVTVEIYHNATVRGRGRTDHLGPDFGHTFAAGPGSAQYPGSISSQSSTAMAEAKASQHTGPAPQSVSIGALSFE